MQAVVLLIYSATVGAYLSDYVSELPEPTTRSQWDAGYSHEITAVWTENSDSVHWPRVNTQLKTVLHQPTAFIGYGLGFQVGEKAHCGPSFSLFAGPIIRDFGTPLAAEITANCSTYISRAENGPEVSGDLGVKGRIALSNTDVGILVSPKAGIGIKIPLFAINEFRIGLRSQLSFYPIYQPPFNLTTTEGQLSLFIH